MRVMATVQESAVLEAYCSVFVFQICNPFGTDFINSGKQGISNHPVYTKTSYLEHFLFLMAQQCNFCHILDIFMCESVFGHSYVSDLCIFIQPCTHIIMSYILKLSGRFNTPIFFFFKNALVIINPLHFCMPFIMKYQFSYQKNLLGFFFTEISSNVQI